MTQFGDTKEAVIKVIEIIYAAPLKLSLQSTSNHQK